MPPARAPALTGEHLVPSYPLVCQRKQRDDLHRVLLEPPVARFHLSELLLEHSERVLNFGPDAGFSALELILQRIHGLVVVQSAALSRARGHMPAYVFVSLGPLVRARWSMSSRWSSGCGALPRCATVGWPRTPRARLSRWAWPTSVRVSILVHKCARDGQLRRLKP